MKTDNTLDFTVGKDAKSQHDKELAFYEKRLDELFKDKERLRAALAAWMDAYEGGELDKYDAAMKQAQAALKESQP